MLFTKQELKIIKFKLMNKGFSEEQAHKEIDGMIKTTRINHLRFLRKEKEAKGSITFKDSFRVLKGKK